MVTVTDNGIRLHGVVRLTRIINYKFYRGCVVVVTKICDGGFVDIQTIEKNSSTELKRVSCSDLDKVHVMSELTLGGIYAIKHRDNTSRSEALRAYLKKYTESSWDTLPESELWRVVKQMFCELVRASDHPWIHVDDMFSAEKWWPSNEIERTMYALEQSRVRTDNGHYMNGFYDFVPFEV